MQYEAQVTGADPDKLSSFTLEADTDTAAVDAAKASVVQSAPLTGGDFVVAVLQGSRVVSSFGVRAEPHESKRAEVEEAARAAEAAAAEAAKQSEVEQAFLAKLRAEGKLKEGV